MKKYNTNDCFNKVPRVIISMSIFDGYTEIGYNNHYSLDTPLPEALSDFFKSMLIEYPQYKIDIKRSELSIKYVDLPKENYNKPLN